MAAQAILHRIVARERAFKYLNASNTCQPECPIRTALRAEYRGTIEESEADSDTYYLLVITHKLSIAVSILVPVTHCARLGSDAVMASS